VVWRRRPRCRHRLRLRLRRSSGGLGFEPAPAAGPGGRLSSPGPGCAGAALASGRFGAVGKLPRRPVPRTDRKRRGQTVPPLHPQNARRPRRALKSPPTWPRRRRWTSELLRCGVLGRLAPCRVEAFRHTQQEAEDKVAGANAHAMGARTGSRSPAITVEYGVQPKAGTLGLSRGSGLRSGGGGPDRRRPCPWRR